MADASSYLVTQITNHLLRTASWTKPTTIYVALYTTMPSNNTGAGAVEVSGGSYARVQVGPSDATWDATGKNVSAVTFPAPTANWGTILGFGLYDASTAGNLLIYDTLVAGKAVNDSDPAPYFDAEQITIAVS